MADDMELLTDAGACLCEMFLAFSDCSYTFPKLNDPVAFR